MLNCFLKIHPPTPRKLVLRTARIQYTTQSLSELLNIPLVVVAFYPDLLTRKFAILIRIINKGPPAAPKFYLDWKHTSMYAVIFWGLWYFVLTRFTSCHCGDGVHYFRRYTVLVTAVNKSKLQIGTYRWCLQIKQPNEQLHTVRIKYLILSARTGNGPAAMYIHINPIYLEAMKSSININVTWPKPLT